MDTYIVSSLGYYVWHSGTNVSVNSWDNFSLINIIAGNCMVNTMYGKCLYKLTLPVYKWLCHFTLPAEMLHTSLTMLGIFRLYNFSHSYDSVADSHCEF